MPPYILGYKPVGHCIHLLHQRGPFLRPNRPFQIKYLLPFIPYPFNTVPYPFQKPHFIRPVLFNLNAEQYIKYIFSSCMTSPAYTLPGKLIKMSFRLFKELIKLLLLADISCNKIVIGRHDNHFKGKLKVGQAADLLCDLIYLSCRPLESFQLKVVEDKEDKDRYKHYHEGGYQLCADFERHKGLLFKKQKNPGHQ